jgi:hypothetical protein
MKRVELLKKLRETDTVFVRHGANHDVFIQPKPNKEAAENSIFSTFRR